MKQPDVTVPTEPITEGMSPLPSPRAMQEALEAIGDALGLRPGTPIDRIARAAIHAIRPCLACEFQAAFGDAEEPNPTPPCPHTCYEPR